MITRIDNKERLRSMMQEADLDTIEVAKMLEARTRRDVSVRAVQAWAAREEKKSSRPCPDWVLANLEEAIRLRQALKSA